MFGIYGGENERGYFREAEKLIFTDIANGRFYNEDCFDAMKEIPDGVIDMILCDLPYGTTAAKWDSVLPLDKLWAEYWRVAKPNAAIILTCMQPFTSQLIISQIDNFKYCWIWDKVNKFTGALNAKIMPMLDYEDVAVFYKNQPIYNPQLREGKYITRHTTGNRNTATVGKSNHTPDVGREVDGLNPKRILSVEGHTTKKSFHPTQKPVPLFEYFIKTYTNENDLVLDNTAGGGTTAIAAINTNRKWVCIEKEKEYYDTSIKRIIDATWK